MSQRGDPQIDLFSFCVCVGGGGGDLELSEVLSPVWPLLHRLELLFATLLCHNAAEGRRVLGGGLWMSQSWVGLRLCYCRYSSEGW